MEVDKSTSRNTVYIRRNIRQIESVDASGEEETTVLMWEYEERQMTPAEYSQYSMIQESTDTITAFQEQTVIDRYTEELIEEGLI